MSDATQTREFLRDATGRPQVFFHGTNKLFTSFDEKSVGSNTGEGWLGNGFYFSHHRDAAESYGITVIEAVLAIERPFEFPPGVNPIRFVREKGGAEAFTDWVKAQGHDGIVSREVLHQVVAFSPEQIQVCPSVRMDAAVADPAQEGHGVTLYRAQFSTAALASRPPCKPSWADDSPIVQNTLSASGRWFTDSREEADWYLSNEYGEGGEIVAVRLPVEQAERFRVSNIPLKPGGKDVPENPMAFSRRPEKEFFLPADLAETATPLRANTMRALGTPEAIHAEMHR
jgi:hypothetical protein